MPKKKVREVKSKAKILDGEKKESKKIKSLEASLELKSETAALSILSSTTSNTLSTSFNVENSPPQSQPKKDNNREFSFYEIQRQRESTEADLKRSYNISMAPRSIHQTGFQGKVSRLNRNSQPLINQSLHDLSDEKERPYDASLRVDTTRAQKKIYPWEM